MIPPDEELCVFMRAGKDKYRAQLFRPRPKDSANPTLSTCRTQIGAENLRASGEVYAGNTGDVLGDYALFLAQAAYDEQLTADETAGLYEGHVDVGGWPDAGPDARLAVANTLFAASRKSSPERYPLSSLA